MRNFLILLLIMAWSIPASAAVLVKSPNGSVAAKTSLSAACTAADAANKTIVVTGSETISTTVVCPSDRTIEIPKGGRLRYSGALTLSGPLIAGEYQIFEKVSAGTLTGLHEVRPEWFGAVGDGSTDDAAVINQAISSMGFSSTSLKAADFTAFYSDWQTPRRLVLRSGARYAIASPLMVEATFSASPYVYYDNFTIEGRGAQIVAKPGFTGVSRSYDTIGGSETINAMLIMGTRDAGKYAGIYQMYNKVIGLQLIGNGDASLAGIYVEAGDGYLFDDLFVQNLGYGIKARVMKFSSIRRYHGVDVINGLYSYNNTAAIKTADPSSKWAAGGSEGGNNVINGFYNIVHPDKLVEARKDVGVLHLYNTGESRISNVTIFGGAQGIRLENLSFAETGYTWDTLTNIEIAETELAPIYLKNRRWMRASNIQLVYNFKNTRAWATADYYGAHLTLDHVMNSSITGLVIDRNNTNSAYLGGNNIDLINGSSGNQFAQITLSGRPGPSDDLYSHVKLTESSYNSFRDVQAAYVDEEFRWKYGFNLDSLSVFNVIDNAYIRVIPTAGNAYLDAGDFNIKRNLLYDSSGRPYVFSEPIAATITSGTSLDISSYDQINFAHGSATDFTGFINSIGAWKIKNILCRFYTANTTLKFGANMLLKDALDVTVPVGGIMMFQVVNDGVSSYTTEISRSF